MAFRSADATWQGTFKEGTGSFKGASGAFEGAFTAKTRFEDAAGTNPEELLAASHAGCFSMAFNVGLERAGFPANHVHTTATLKIEKLEAGFRVTEMRLVCDASVPNIDDAKFQELATAAKNGCPISNALSKDINIILEAKLV